MWAAPPPIRNEIGRYMTTTTDWDSIQQGNTFSRMIPITPPASLPPRVVVGLNYMDMSNTDYVWRINAYVDEIGTNQFLAHIDTWATTSLYNGGVSWLRLAASDPDFQCGVCSFSGEGTTSISFGWRYDSPPSVFVGLCGFDIGDNPRISVYATDIDQVGFTLHAEKWGSTDFYGCGATWIAFPSDKQGIQCGTFGADYTISESYAGSITFSTALERSPMVFTAFTSLDVDREQSMRMRLDVKNVSAQGMDWSISTWGGSRIYAAQGAYIALV